MINQAQFKEEAIAVGDYFHKRGLGFGRVCLQLWGKEGISNNDELLHGRPVQ